MPRLIVIGSQIKDKQRGAQCAQPNGSKRPQVKVEAVKLLGQVIRFIFFTEK